MGGTTLPAELIEAYRSARYEVAEPPLELRIDVANPDLAVLHAMHAVSCSAFITACNPASRLLSRTENQRRSAELACHANDAGLLCLAANSRDAAGRWPDEPSLLILGASRAWACETARRFGQNALLYSGKDATPQLVLLR